MFFDRGHLRFRNFNSAITVHVIGVKSYVDSFLDRTFVLLRVSINKLNLFPTWIVAGLVDVLFSLFLTVLLGAIIEVFMSGKKESEGSKVREN